MSATFAPGSWAKCCKDVMELAAIRTGVSLPDGWFAECFPTGVSDENNSIANNLRIRMEEYLRSLQGSA